MMLKEKIIQLKQDILDIKLALTFCSKQAENALHYVEHGKKKRKILSSLKKINKKARYSLNLN